MYSDFGEVVKRSALGGKCIVPTGIFDDVDDARLFALLFGMLSLFDNGCLLSVARLVATILFKIQRLWSTPQCKTQAVNRYALSSMSIIERHKATQKNTASPSYEITQLLVTYHCLYQSIAAMVRVRWYLGNTPASCNGTLPGIASALFRSVRGHVDGIHVYRVHAAAPVAAQPLAFSGSSAPDTVHLCAPQTWHGSISLYSAAYRAGVASADNSGLPFRPCSSGISVGWACAT